MRDGWQEKTLASLLTHVIGGTWGKPPGESEVEVLAFGTKAFSSGSPTLDPQVGTQRSVSASQYNRRALIDGDIVLEVSGGSENQPVGRVLVVEGDTPNVIPSSFMRLLRFDTAQIHPRYALAALQWLYASGVSARCQSNTTGIRNLSVPEYLESRIPLPPIEEQLPVVDLLAALDETIAAAAEAYATLANVLLHVRESLFSSHYASGSVVMADLLERVSIPVAVRRDSSYTEIGIRSHGKGVFIKESIHGADLGNKKVFRMSPGLLAFNIVFAWEGAVTLLGKESDGKIASHRFPTYKSQQEGAADILEQFFLTKRGRNLLGLCSPGGAGRNRTLNQRALLSSRIALPEQSHWPAVLETLAATMSSVAAAEYYLARLRHLRSELLSDLISGAHSVPSSYGLDDLHVLELRNAQRLVPSQ